MNDFGYHTVWDITGADEGLLRNDHVLHEFFLKALAHSKFTVLNHMVHKFSGGGEGVTGLYLLSESHLSYHTYPDNRYISIDVYTCGKNNGPINERIVEFFGKDVHVSTNTLKRGSKICVAV